MQLLRLILVASLAAGCGCRPAPPAPAAAPVQGYAFEIRAADGSTTSGQAETFSIQAGDHLVVMKNSTLSINGRSYGRVPDGASIYVNDERVFINGVETPPTD